MDLRTLVVVHEAQRVVRLLEQMRAAAAERPREVGASVGEPATK